MALDLASVKVNFDLERQAIILPDSEKPGYSPVYANPILSDLSLTTTTTYDLFNEGRDIDPQAPCLGRRPWITLPANHPSGKKADFAPYYTWISYEQVEELRTSVGSALTYLGRNGSLSPDGKTPIKDTEWHVALWCQNRPEYQIVDLADLAYTRVTVSLYEATEPDMAEYILNHSETKVLFTTSNHLRAVLDQVEKLPHLRAIVLLEDGNPEASPLPPSVLSRAQLIDGWVQTAKQKAPGALSFYSWTDLIELGRANLVAHMPPSSGEAIASLCYTSGTTGKPKGALVAHRQLANATVNPALSFPGKVVHISYLPLAHIYGRLIESACLRNGSAIGFFNGDVTRLMEDCQVLQPSLFATVPRVINRIASLVWQQAEGAGLKAKLLKHALDVKVQNYERDGSIHHAFYDKLVFSKVAGVLGGKVKYVVTGSAPARPEVLRLLRIALRADVREGYGLTETTGASLLMFPGDRKLGTCGPPTMGSWLRLKDAPELGYTSKDRPFPRGEIQGKGANIFPGYYKDEKKTKEALDEEGWFSTGDVGEIDAQGRVKIIDRVKNLLKLAQGEYVALERVESTYLGSPLIAQLWIHGESTETFIIAVVVPDPATFAPFASKVLGKPVSPEDGAALKAATEDPKVTSAVLEDLARVGRAARLNGFEIVKGLHLTVEPFSVENGLLTPTFKVKRPEAKKYYSEQIKKLYAAGPAETGSKKGNL
ncbi:medium-chain fatty acid-CoA ligase faa2 [Tilletia horrida]|uniref:Medium-chain fatty acid-CoA ligase faa2 n=1 Tax=Tilletia horrida TaxID=155126 RepID=A0AAN6GRL3_9BASI|nr:medium-chain fatty acid-CoA ligase faa2 [Tilletia horrida]KAK0553933.1 medium-chain fatty acid-CoA ligase faa2 [Tilletia horrida]KAK0567487.1 medium-chain fatty acid-CoA ligase faa2 [Tilletia horrida]